MIDQATVDALNAIMKMVEGMSKKISDEIIVLHVRIDELERITGIHERPGES